MKKSQFQYLIPTVLFLAFVIVSIYRIYTLTQQNIYYKTLLEAELNREGRIIPEDKQDETMPEQPPFRHKQFIWPGGQNLAVSICYDDGLPSHFGYVAPLLAKYNLRATFYPVGNSLMKYPDQWTHVAKSGHELGNHSLFHPCRRPKINPAYHLANYNRQRWMDEMSTANFILKSIDGKDERTFAMPCAQFLIGPEGHQVSVKPLFPKLFLAARSYADGNIIVPENLDLFALPSFAADLHLKTFEHMLSVVEKAKKVSGWVIFTFHGFDNNEHWMVTDRGEHEKLISYLSENKKQIWTSPIIKVSRYLKKER